MVQWLRGHTVPPEDPSLVLNTYTRYGLITPSDSRSRTIDFFWPPEALNSQAQTPTQIAIHTHN